MMKKLKDTLARLGSTQLASFLDASTVNLLEVLDLRNLSPKNLSELVIQRFGPDGILLNRAMRNEVFSALSETDAETLHRLLQLPKTNKPWSTLSDLPLRRQHHTTNLLFTFFGCPLPDDKDDEDMLSEPIKPIEPKYALFSHQWHAYHEVIQKLTQPSNRRVMLHMPTGSGKTRTAMQVIASFLRDRMQEGEVVVWLAFSEELCSQAADEFEQAWDRIGIRPVNIFRHFGPYKVDMDQIANGILIGGLSLLYEHSLRYQGAFLKLAQRTPLVIMDEAHQAIAPTYKHLLNLLATDLKTAILGLSATPGRSWADPAQDIKLAQFFFGNKVTLKVEGYKNPVDYLQNEGYIAKIEYDYIRFSPDADFELTAQERSQLQQDLDIPDSVIERLAVDHKRNFLILSRLMQEADKGSKILFFACSVSHANLISNLLRIKDYKAEAITSNTPADHRRQVIAEYRKGDGIQILTNYGVLTTGFDAPKTNVAMITRPTRSVVLYSQMIGRAARGPKVGGNAQCSVITVVDNIPGFRSIAESFTFWDDIWTDIERL